MHNKYHIQAYWLHMLSDTSSTCMGAIDMRYTDCIGVRGFVPIYEKIMILEYA